MRPSAAALNVGVSNGTQPAALSAALLDGQGNIIGWLVTATFANTPAVTTLKLTNWRKGDPTNVIALDVTVVEVDVKNPAGANAFSTGVPSSSGLAVSPLGNPVTIDDKKYTDETKILSLKSYTKEKQTDPDVPGLKWQADVTLTGPGPGGKAGVDKITVGFVQHVTQVARSVKFGSGTVLTLEPATEPGREENLPGFRHQRESVVHPDG